MFNVIQTDNPEDIIRYCYTNDSSIEQYSRNKDSDLEGRITKEIDCLKDADLSFKFYTIYNEGKLAGYFATEEYPVDFLTTFFITPEYRQYKLEIWNIIVSYLPSIFCSALFKVNTRAINFFQKNGGLLLDSNLVAENKAAVLFQFVQKEV